MSPDTAIIDLAGRPVARSVSPVLSEETASSTRVRKRDGSSEPIDVNKFVRAMSRCCAALRVATRTVSGLNDGATTRELDELSIHTAASLMAEQPDYSRLATRLLATYIDTRLGADRSLIVDSVVGMATRHSRKLDDAIEPAQSQVAVGGAVSFDETF